MSFVLAEKEAGIKSEVKQAISVAVGRVKNLMEKYSSGDVYPAWYQNGKYTPIKNGDPKGFRWTEGFWTGQLWLCYEETGDDSFRLLAEKNVEDFYKRVRDNYHIDWHHDLGFLYTPSCVASYMLTGNELAKKAALMAAYSLSRRFRHTGNFIQSMSTEIDEANYKFIVDTMLNVPLLFWAAEETGDDSYRDKAVKHINTTLKYALREDGTTYHHVLMDNKTGEMRQGLTWQGAGDNSCWSRGQAWLIYGLALAYAYTKDNSIIGHFYKAADYFFEHLPKDSVPYWDFIFTDGDDEPRDSSAAAIAICGILEMAKHLTCEDENMQRYIEKTVIMLRSLINNYAVAPDTEEEGILLHSTGGKPQGFWDECLSYGDYFYIEALVRAERDWKKYW